VLPAPASRVPQNDGGPAPPAPSPNAGYVGTRAERIWQILLASNAD